MRITYASSKSIRFDTRAVCKRVEGGWAHQNFPFFDAPSAHRRVRQKLVLCAPDAMTRCSVGLCVSTRVRKNVNSIPPMRPTTTTIIIGNRRNYNNICARLIAPRDLDGCGTPPRDFPSNPFLPPDKSLAPRDLSNPPASLGSAHARNRFISEVRVHMLYRYIYAAAHCRKVVWLSCSDRGVTARETR